MQGQGTKFFYYNGTAFVQVANLMEIEPPNAERSSVERTPMDQTGQYRNFYPGVLVDAGEITLSLISNYQAAEQVALLAAIKTAGNSQFKIELPDTGTTTGTQLTFTGHITSIGGTIPAEEDLMRPIKIKVSGEPTVTDPD